MKIAITLILLIGSIFANGQDTYRIDKKSFLIGTLSDYMGRTKYREAQDRVDRYDLYEKSLSTKLDSLFKDSVPDVELRTIKNRTEIYSKSLAELIDGYYTYEPSGSMAKGRDTIYRGKLKGELLKTNKEILSFIAGVYTRFGERNDTTMCIRIYNSYSKAKICKEFLEKMNCKNVKYVVRKGYIPTSHIIYFDPTPELLGYLKEFMGLRKQLEADWNKQIKEMIGEDSNKKFVR